MGTSQAKKESLLYLDRITLQVIPTLKYTLRLSVDNRERELQRINNHTWEPTKPLDASPTSQMHVEIQVKRAHLSFGRKEQGTTEIDCQALFKDYWDTTAHEFLVQADIVAGNHSCSLELQFSAEVTTGDLRSSLHELERLLRDYSPLMTESTEKALEKGIKFGAAFSELNEIAKAAFSVATVTFELLQEQNKYDQMPLDLLDRLDRILFFADKVADEVSDEETEILKKTISRMFKVMEKVAECSCNYVKRGRFERTLSGLAHPHRIDEMSKELTKVIEDFDRAMDVETLRLAKESKSRIELVQQDLLLKERLKPTRTGYDRALCCMEGTRQSILDQVIAWVANGLGPSNTYWIHGLPGIGKTSLSHSICKTLDERNQLIGAFFCQRDDTNSNEPRNILPTLIYKLAENSSTFRRIVEERLLSKPNLTAKSMTDTHFLDFIRSTPSQPNEHPRAFIIDALDECGDNRSRQDVLKALTEAAALAPWLKIIITSRPEADIERFFRGLTGSPHSSYDLTADQKASDDLRNFARSQFNLVASHWYLPTPWPEESDFNKLISRANGLFIFVKTLALALEKSSDAEKSLKEALQGPAGTGLESLYGLYSSILKAGSNIDGFWRMIVVTTTAQYRPLRKETIAELSGVKLNLVEKWVDTLSSLLYRDEGANGAIRVRHLSISDFFLSDRCEYQVNLREAHAQQGIACLETMVKGLRFNICNLEDSRLANTDIRDLPSRVKQNVSDPLQYSCLHWSNHLCSSATRDERLLVLRGLKNLFGGLYPLFWVEVLSIMGMVPIGAQSLRRLLSWVRDVDSALLERIQDIRHFLITFHTPISISAPHIYISTGPFLPSQSPLSRTLSKEFTSAIKVRVGNLLSWPAPPLKWTGHTGYIMSVCYSPNGTRVVTGSRDKTIRIWDAESGAVVGEHLTGHSGDVNCVAYSPDGQHIISGSNDCTIRIWDAETGASVGNPLDGHTGRVWSVAYSPDGRRIVSGSEDHTVRIWDAETGTSVGEHLRGHNGGVNSVAYSPDGQYIISGSSDRTIRIWDAKTGASVGNPLDGHTGWVWSVAYSPDGQHIVSGSFDRTIRIWDAETGASVGDHLIGHNDGVNSVAYSPDGQYIISGSDDRTIRIWDAETGASVGNPLDGHTAQVWSVAYSPDGQRIISGSKDHTVRIWDAETGTSVGEHFRGHNGGVNSVAYSPDGQYIISGSDDRTIRIWDAKTGASVRNPLDGHTAQVGSVAYSPNGQHIVSGSDDCTIRIWDAETDASVGEHLIGHNGGVNSVAYSPDGQYIISGSSDHTIRIWDAKTGASVGNPLYGRTTWVLSVAYSPDGRRIVSGSLDCTIRIWDAETGASVGDPLKGHADNVRSVAYSPDGQRIISGSDDRTIRTWDSEVSTEAAKLREWHTNLVQSIDYSSDAQHTVSCNPIQVDVFAKPDMDGWVRDSEGGLLYWVPHDCRAGLHSPALLTIPLTCHIRSVSLDFDDFAFGTSWTRMYKNAPY